MTRPLFFLTLLLLSTSLFAQYTAEDYKKADSIVNDLSKSIFYKVDHCFAIKGGSLFWYKTQTPDGERYYVVDPLKEHKRDAFNHDNLAKLLAEKSGKKVKVSNLPLRNEKFNTNADTLKFNAFRVKWIYSIAKNELKEEGEVPDRGDRKHWATARDELAKDPVQSPDSQWTAYIEDYNVFVKNCETKEKFQLSFDGSPGEFYSSYIKWAPNSKYLACCKFRPSEKRYMRFMESSPKGQLQPKLHEFEYFKPGDALPLKKPALFHIESKKQITIPFQKYLNQYHLSDPKWREDSRAFTFEYNERGHQRYIVFEADAETGKLLMLAKEEYETFFNYSGKKFRYDVNDGEEMIWMSERNGWNHLYLYDDQGRVKNQITTGNWVVRDVEMVDEENREIVFSAGGMNIGEDPYHIHYYRIGFNGKKLKKLTPEYANHVVTFSDDSLYMIDYYSRADFPGQTVLRSAKNGNVLLELETVDVEEMKLKGWNSPEVFKAKGRDGETDIWGLIYRPVNFDPNKKYPIIEYIYAGPHSAFVPKSFKGVNRRFAGLAELGFVCVQIDGMGTSLRSKAFHDVCWKNLKDAGFPDRIAWMKAAAEKYSFLDTTRVGIFGGSAGGQSSTGAVLFHPEFYDVAVSSCGCHDNRMDKIWWNEQWMGYPVGPEYAECSNVVNAHKLKGNLMLILGEVDDNVDPASTLQVADALITADKDFELVVLTGVNHTLGGSYGERKRRDFFIRHLKMNETPDWNSIK